MKILPDYLINIMPEIEEAIEELKLSVMDHAYDLLRCLDIDELSTDDIRHKLEVLNLRMDNLTESWLPNGRFYRIYPLIKYNRARLNALQSVIKSGGQFEGLWSNQFNKKTEHNYKYIHSQRHYEISSPADGYFFITGNVTRNSNGTISSSDIKALSSDVLLSHALPAGYTYIYSPWPRPAYPGDSDYFYNVNMLQFDRLHYSVNCDYPLGDGENNNKGDDNPVTYYGEEKPASVKYETDYLTPLPTPYWFDYHYLGGTYDTEPNKYKYITEKGHYYDEEGHELYTAAGGRVATQYVLDASCEELGDSNALFPTNCYLITHHLNSTPTEDTTNNTINPYLYDYNCSLDTDSDKPHVDKFVPKSFATQHTKHLSADGYDFNMPHYRFDNLLSKALITHDLIHHIKTYRPIWNENAIFAGLSQSSYTSSTLDDSAHNSLLHWVKYKQDNLVTNMIGFDANTDSCTKLNKPAISDITHTSIDRPTAVRSDIIYNDFVVPATTDNSQYTEYRTLVDDTKLNSLYDINKTEPVTYDPTLFYSIIGLGKIESDGPEYYNNNITLFVKGSHNTNELFICKNGDTHKELSFINYKTSRVHRYYFYNSSLGTNNVTLDHIDKVYNQYGISDLFISSTKLVDNVETIINNIDLIYTILGLYDINNQPVEYDSGYLKLYLHNSKYEIMHSAFTLNNTPVQAAYVLCTVSIKNQPADEIDDSPTHLAALTEDSIIEYKGNVIEQLVPSRPSRECEFIDSQNVVEQLVPSRPSRECEFIDSQNVVEQLVPSIRPSRECEFIDSQNMIIEAIIDSD